MDDMREKQKRFDRIVDISGMGSLQYVSTDPSLKEKGIISFEGAEMSFATAPSVIASVRKTAESGIYGFTLADAPYLQHVVWWMKEIRNWDITEDMVVPVHGTIFSIASMIRMCTDKGDGVMAMAPVYPRYEQAVRRLERNTVYVPMKCSRGYYSMDLNRLEDAFRDKRNKLLIICNPHNPVSRVWKKEELSSIAYLSRKYGRYVISDETFAEMVFDGNMTVPYTSIPDAGEYGVVVTSLGKTFNFTGVNHANVIIEDPELRDRYIKQKYSDHYGSVGPFEYAAIKGAYCPEGREWMEDMLSYIKENRDILKDGLESIFPDVIISPVEGTSVMWTDWSGCDLPKAPHRFLLEDALVQTQDGNEFGPGGKSHTRWNFSVGRDQIRNALERLDRAATVLKEGGYK